MKKHHSFLLIIRRLAIPILLVIMLLSSIPFAVAEADSGEVVDLRTQYSKTFHGNGTNLIKRNYLSSIHYEDDNGKFQSIDTNIVPSERVEWDWEVAKGHWQLFIRNDTTVALKKNSNRIGYRLHGIAYLDIVTKDYTILQTPNNVTPQINGNTIEWLDIFYGTDYKIHYTNDSFKSDLILSQDARNLLNSPGYRPGDYGYNTSDTFFVPIFECDWSNSLPMRLKDGTTVTPNEAETENNIYFLSPTIDPLWKTKLISFLPIGNAISVNPLNPEDPKEEWIFASVRMRKRLITRNDKHWLLEGVRVTALNQMPTGDIIIDPVTTLRPNGDGSELAIPNWYTPGTGWQASGAGTNWPMVDEASCDDLATCVGDVSGAAPLPYKRDLYAIPNHTTESGTINSVKIYLCVLKGGTGTRYYTPVLRTNGTTVDGIELGLTDDNAFTTISQTWTDNPVTTDPWTWDEIDALEIGVGVEKKGANSPICSQVYVEVDYTPPLPPTADPRDPDLVYLEIRPDLDETRIVGQGAPTSVQFPAGGVFYGYSLDIWGAGANQFEELYYQVCVPDRWDGETDILVHIDSALDSAGEANNGYQLDIAWEVVTPNIEVVPAAFISDSAVRLSPLSNLQYYCYRDWFILDFDAPTPAVIEDDDIAFRLRRSTVGGWQETDLDGELIIIHAGVLFSRGDLLGSPPDISTFITEEDMEEVALELAVLNAILDNWTFYGHVFLVVLLLILAFWRRDIFFYLIACPVLITFGLRWYDIYHNPAGFAMGLALVATGLYCLILAIVNILRK